MVRKRKTFASSSKSYYILTETFRGVWVEYVICLSCATNMKVILKRNKHTNELRTQINTGFAVYWYIFYSSCGSWLFTSNFQQYHKTFHTLYCVYRLKHSRTHSDERTHARTETCHCSHPPGFAHTGILVPGHSLSKSYLLWEHSRWHLSGLWKYDNKNAFTVAMATFFVLARTWSGMQCYQWRSTRVTYVDKRELHKFLVSSSSSWSWLSLLLL